MTKMRFVVEVDASEHNMVLSDHPPRPEDIASVLHRSILEGCGYYPMFNYNTFTVEPME